MHARMLSSVILLVTVCHVGAICPPNVDGGPSQVDLTVTAARTDVDVGWTGIFHGFPLPAPTTLKACLSGCGLDGASSCDAVVPTGPSSLNGTTFGTPLPLMSAGVPVCVEAAWNGSPTGTIHPRTGEANFQVNLRISAYVTSPGHVCPRCLRGVCDAGPNEGDACVAEATVTVPHAEGDKVYDLSNQCPPEPSDLVASFDLALPLRTGTARIDGPRPCAGQGQDDSCAGAGCAATCTGNACTTMGTDPVTGSTVCVDSKGGLSQTCCNGNSALPCFPTSGGGGLERVGRSVPPLLGLPDPVFPKVVDGAVLASVFCLPATAASVVNLTLGLPGPGALVVPVTQRWDAAPACVGDVDGRNGMQTATDVVYIARHLFGLNPVPPSFRLSDPTIPSDATVAAKVDALCPMPESP